MLPPAAKASEVVPSPASNCPLAVLKSPISVQLEPSQNSVLAKYYGAPPPNIITDVLLVPG